MMCTAHTNTMRKGSGMAQGLWGFYNYMDRLSSELRLDICHVK